MKRDCDFSISVTLAPSDVVGFPWSRGTEDAHNPLVVGQGARVFCLVALRLSLERLLSRLVRPVEGRQPFKIQFIGQVIKELSICTKERKDEDSYENSRRFGADQGKAVQHKH